MPKGKTVLLICVACMFLLVPIISAVSLEKINIGDKTIRIQTTGGVPVVDIQLIENTNQCLIDCYAILRIRPYKNITLPASPNSEFRWNFIKAKAEMLGLRDYRFEVLVGGKWKHFTYWGKTLQADKDYYIKLVGRKYATNETNNIDWIPTIKGFQISEWAWWNSSWKCKAPINVSVSSGATEKNHTIMLNVSYDTYSCSGNTQIDFDDLRFLNGLENTELDYWIEYNASSSYANVWVEIDQNITTTNYTIFMYYGNDIVSTTSNGTETFPYWNGSCTNCWLATPDNYTENYTVRAKILEDTAERWWGFTHDSTHPRLMIYASTNCHGAEDMCYNSLTTGHETLGGNFFNELHTFEIIRNGTTDVITTVDDTNLQTHTYQAQNTRVIAGDASYPINQVDWFLVRKWYYPEPITSLEAEEFGFTIVLNVSAFSLNLTDLTFDINISNTTESYFKSGLTNPGVLFDMTPPNGTVNVTVSSVGYANRTYSGTIQNTTIWNLTAILYPINEFHAENAATAAVINTFTVIVSNATLSVSNGTVTGKVLLSHEHMPYGSVNVRIISDGYNTTDFSRIIDNDTVINESFPIYGAGFHIIVKDEVTYQVLTFNITLANSTVSETITNITNLTRSWGNLTQGESTITIKEWNESDVDYQQRHYYHTFSKNVNISMIGYLLQTADGITVRLHMRDSGGDSVEGVLVTAQKFISGAWTTVEQDESDGAGIARLFLNPDTIYRLIFEYGGVTWTETFQPSTNDYTFVIGEGIEIDLDMLFRGISYKFEPIGRLLRNMTYVNYTIWSMEENIEYYGMNISIRYNSSLFFQNITTPSHGGIIYGLINLTNASLNDIVNVYAWFKETGYDPYYFNISYGIYNETYLNATLWGAIQNMFDPSIGFSATDGKLFVIFLCMFVIAGAGFSLRSWWGGGIISLGIIGMFTFATTPPLFAITEFIIITFGVFGLYAIKSGWG